MKTGNNHAFLFLFLFLLLIEISAVTASHAPRRQVDALNKLLSDKATTKLNKANNSNNDEIIDDSSLNSLFERVRSSSSSSSQHGLKEKDEITKLPGQPKNADGFRQYGGYVTIDQKNGKSLFYYFVEADGLKPSSAAPLVLWLNGGPGCSSLGFGAMEELGPFRVMSDGKTLFKNPYAWNKVANVLFLESPVGVGYSYSNNTEDYDTMGDKQTAEDAYVFLVNWLERFPEYKGREFFLAGESYAGHYVPQLAHVILQHNKHHKHNIINFKGIMIGNAAIDDETDTRGLVDYLWTHALISDEAIAAIHKNCNFSTLAGAACANAMAEVNRVFNTIDIYNIYAPDCFSSNTTAKPKRASIYHFDPCSDYYIEAYMNLPEVQRAFHANVTKLKHPWSACSDILNWQDSASTVLPILQKLSAHDIRILVFSGDIDGRVPITSTRYALNKLKRKVKTPWQLWTVNQEVAGYSVVYDGRLTLATVRGAGHEVPSYQPQRALTLFKYFLEGKLLPN